MGSLSALTARVYGQQKARRQAERPAVVWHSGTGDGLVWLPVAICVGLMVSILVWSNWMAGTETVPSPAEASSNPAIFLGR